MHANRGRGPLLRLPCIQLMGRAWVLSEHSVTARQPILRAVQFAALTGGMN